ncbi:MAG: putative rhamnosyl transferase [Bacteroidales bacterium]|jgi:hypothetical protein|nr:putative rhamnosyl transferase [Bacteroidales bacterium]
MEKEYSHFLLTRFNLKLWQQDKNGKKTHSDTWLAERFRLFETYCLPAIAAQTCKNFRWIVLFDSDTPYIYKRKIDLYKTKCEQFIPLFLRKEEASGYTTFLNEQIRQLVVDDSKCIITTRLDNDDAVNVNYIAEIQRIIGNQNVKNEFCLSFSWGLQYFEKWSFAVRIKFPNNHFISLIEPNKVNYKLKNVYEIEHLKVKYSCEVLNINNKDNAWLEVVHSLNASNDVKIKNLQYPILQNTDMSDFFLKNIKLKFSTSLFSFLFKYFPQCIKHTWLHNRFWGIKTNEVK